MGDLTFTWSTKLQHPCGMITEHIEIVAANRRYQSWDHIYDKAKEHGYKLVYWKLIETHENKGENK